jgi:hypothetical protein
MKFTQVLNRAAAKCIRIYLLEGMTAAALEETRQAKMIAKVTGEKYWSVREQLNDTIANAI